MNTVTLTAGPGPKLVSDACLKFSLGQWRRQERRRLRRQALTRIVVLAAALAVTSGVLALAIAWVWA